MNENYPTGILIVIAVLSFFFIFGVVIFIGAVKKWNILMNPSTPQPPMVYTAAVIKKHFGEKDLRAYWFLFAIACMIVTSSMIMVTIRDVHRENQILHVGDIVKYSANGTRRIGTVVDVEDIVRDGEVVRYYRVSLGRGDTALFYPKGLKLIKSEHK